MNGPAKGGLAAGLLVLLIPIMAWGQGVQPRIPSIEQFIPKQIEGLPLLQFGQTVRGSIDQTDAVSEEGLPFDAYLVTVEQEAQPYLITVRSPDFPAGSALARVEPAVGEQAALVFEAGQQVQYSGMLTQPGQYLLLVTPAAEEPQAGDYTLTLSAQAVAECAGGTQADPIALTVGTPVACALGPSGALLQDPQGNTHFARFFTLQGTGEPLTFVVEGQAFEPALLLFDPQTQQFAGRFDGELNTLADLNGPVTVAITSQQADAVGPFQLRAVPGMGEGFQIQSASP